MTQPPSPTPTLTLDYHRPEEPTKPAGLIVWGVILCVLALGAGCLAAFMPVVMYAQTPQAMPLATVLMAMAVYLALAAGGVVLALACFRAQRWVRKVMLVLAWPALVLTAISVPIAAASAGLAPLPAGTPAGVRVGAVAATVILGLGIGAGLLAAVLYFRRETLRLRLGHLDPERTWTDGRPTPVLGLALWMALGSLLLLIGSGATVAMFFGAILHGVPAVALVLAQAALLALGAWLVYHKRLAGWWIALVLVVAVFGSSIVTILVQGGEAVVMAGMPADQQELMRGNPLLSTPFNLATTTTYLTGLIGVLLWVRFYFGREDGDND